MTDLPTLEDALKLADQDSPLPSLAGPALKVLRARIVESEDYEKYMRREFYRLTRLFHNVGPCPVCGDDNAEDRRSISIAEGKLFRCIACGHTAGCKLWPPNPSAAQHADSATITALIAELRSREAVGRQKYGTDVDRTDLTNAQWRQHLREELMDALLYSLAEERTQPQGIIFMDGDYVRMPSVLTPAMEYDWFNLPPNMAATASNRYRNMRDGLARRSNTSIKGSPHD